MSYDRQSSTFIFLVFKKYRWLPKREESKCSIYTFLAIKCSTLSTILRKIMLYAAMSAIDTALWDIKGKAFGVPVYQLLGGKTNGKLRTYASQLQFDWDKECKKLIEPEEYGQAALKAVAEGYDAVKVDPIVYDHNGESSFDRTKLFTKPQMRLFGNRLRAIREAVGEDVDIIFESF